ncbi:MAG: hypothetical protein QNJ40_05330 [Xanthomonadales bacterium]|nr:hypothetical protein [Xanthomonadales bacterium]
MRAALLLFFCAFFCAGVQAQPTVFSYQGELRENGNPVRGTVDLEFGLFDAETGGTLLAPEQFEPGVLVSGGVFTLEIDFADSVLAEGELWLETRVRTTGQSEFAALTPRHRITAVLRAGFAQVAAMNSVDSAAIALNAVTTDDLATDAVATRNIFNGSVETNHIQAGAVGSNHIPAGAVTTAKIAPNAVVSGKIAPNAVGPAEIAPSAIGTSELDINSVGSAEIADGAVGSSELQADSVGAGKIAPGAVTSNKFVDGSVGAVDVDANEIQLRVTGQCPPGTQMRAIGVDGSVTCEPDDEGISGFGIPRFFVASVTDGGGLNRFLLASTAFNLCFLTQVQHSDMDSSGEEGSCEVVIAGTSWFLDAFANTDANVECRAACLSMLQ